MGLEEEELEVYIEWEGTAGGASFSLSSINIFSSLSLIRITGAGLPTGGAIGWRVEVDAVVVDDEGTGVLERDASFEEADEKSRFLNADAIVASGFESADEAVLCGEVVVEVAEDDDDALLAVESLDWFFDSDECDRLSDDV